MKFITAIVALCMSTTVHAQAMNSEYQKQLDDFRRAIAESRAKTDKLAIEANQLNDAFIAKQEKSINEISQRISKYNAKIDEYYRTRTQNVTVRIYIQTNR